MMRLAKLSGLAFFWGSIWGAVVWFDFVNLNHALSLADAAVVWLEFIVLYSLICFIIAELLWGILKSLMIIAGKGRVWLENECNFRRIMLFVLFFINLVLFNLSHFWLTSSGKLTAGLLSILSSLKDPVNMLRMILILVVSVVLAVSVEVIWRWLVIRLKPWLVAVSANALILVFFLSIRMPGTGLDVEDLRNNTMFQVDPLRENQEVILVGLDGADWKVLDYLHERRLIPNLSVLIENGCRGRLKTLVPAYSPIVWTSIATGKRPEHHGMTDFISYEIPGVSLPCLPRKKPYFTGGVPFLFRIADRIGLARKMPISSLNRRCCALWNICSINRLHNCNIGWWGTFPAELNRGIIVSDYFHTLAVDNVSVNAANIYSKAIYPDSLFSLLLPFVLTEKIIDYQVYRRFINGDSTYWKRFPLDSAKEGYNPEKSLKQSYPEDLTHINIWTKYLSKFKWSLTSIYLKGIDKLSHATFKYFMEDRLPGNDKYANTLKNYYIFTDSLIGEIFLARPDAICLIVSDHGFHLEGEHSYYHHRQGPDGIFIISGPGIEQGCIIKNLHVLDILPTLCYLMGMPVGRDMPGRVIEELFTETFRSTHQLDFIDSYDNYTRRKIFIPSGWEANERVETELIEQLKAIGYID